MSPRVQALSLAAASLIALITTVPLDGVAQTAAPAQPSIHGGMMQEQTGHMDSGHMMRGMSPAAAVENRIKELHGQLKITADQETAWNSVAQVMRDDAKAVEAVAVERQKDLSTMSAVDNLRSFQRLAQTHADGLTKLADAFAELYATMSDSQKKNADAAFRYEGRHGMSGRMGSRP